METGGSLRAPDSVRKLQTALHAKAKGSPDFRFYSLSDKVWRADVLETAWQTVRHNGGAAGVNDETVQSIEAQGVEQRPPLGPNESNPVALQQTTNTTKAEKTNADICLDSVFFVLSTCSIANY